MQSVDQSARRTTPTIRYFVKEIDAAVDFYCQYLGFAEELRPSPVFAMLYRGDLRLLLSVPGTHPGGHALPDGTLPTPGGWNRALIQVADLDATVESLRRAGVHFRDDQPSGVAVRQVLPGSSTSIATSSATASKLSACAPFSTVRAPRWA